METEAIVDYVARLLNCDRMYSRTDMGILEFIPHEMAKTNAKTLTHDHTYYFSIVTSYKGTRIMNKSKEFLSEP
jgi:hypothetical protein